MGCAVLKIVEMDADKESIVNNVHVDDWTTK